jgi:hypothetical protein
MATLGSCSTPWLRCDVHPFRCGLVPLPAQLPKKGLAPVATESRKPRVPQVTKKHAGPQGIVGSGHAKARGEHEPVRRIDRRVVQGAGKLVLRRRAAICGGQKALPASRHFAYYAARGPQFLSHPGASRQGSYARDR